MGWTDIVKLIAGSLIIIFAAYYTTFFVATRKTKKFTGRQIDIKERFALSKDKTICIIGVGGKVYLVIVTNGGATVLDTYTAQEYAEIRTEKPDAASGFSQGAVQRGIMSGLDFLRKGFASRSSATRMGEDNQDFSAAMKRAADDDIINAYTENKDKTPGLDIAQEEDGIDEMYRRLKNRKASGTSSGRGESSDD